MSLTTATLHGDQGQAHYFTGNATRPNSSAGTEGMIRELREYRDAFGPNELLAPVAVIYSYPEEAMVATPEPGTLGPMAVLLLVALAAWLWRGKRTREAKCIGCGRLVHSETEPMDFEARPDEMHDAWHCGCEGFDR